MCGHRPPIFKHVGIFEIMSGDVKVVIVSQQLEPVLRDWPQDPVNS
jgi:hypothetical protein